MFPFMTYESDLNPYLVLGVPDFADGQQIVSAYRRLARRYHPDLNQDPHAKERMQEINWAYKLLGHPEERARFDRKVYASALAGQNDGSKQYPGHEPPNGSPRSKRLARMWIKVFAHDLRFMRRRRSAVIAGMFVVITIFGVSALLANSSLGLMIALPSAWLIVMFRSASPAGRSSALIGTALGLIGSTLICGAITILMTGGDLGSDSYIVSGRVIWLFAMPIAAIVGGLVGMMGDEG